MPGDGAEFSKRPPRHLRNQKPQSLNVWCQIFQKRGKQKKLFETDITPERKEIVLSSDENRASRASPKTFRSGRVPPTPAAGHSPRHDGYIRHTATEMIILMTDISVIWHSTGKWRLKRKKEFKKDKQKQHEFKKTVRV